MSNRVHDYELSKELTFEISRVVKKPGYIAGPILRNGVTIKKLFEKFEKGDSEDRLDRVRIVAFADTNEVILLRGRGVNKKATRLIMEHYSIPNTKVNSGYMYRLVSSIANNSMQDLKSNQVRHGDLNLKCYIRSIKLDDYEEAKQLVQKYEGHVVNKVISNKKYKMDK